jgi:hypothetical protein
LETNRPVGYELDRQVVVLACKKNCMQQTPRPKPQALPPPRTKAIDQ